MSGKQQRKFREMIIKAVGNCLPLIRGKQTIRYLKFSQVKINTVFNIGVDDKKIGPQI